MGGVKTSFFFCNFGVQSLYFYDMTFRFPLVPAFNFSWERNRAGENYIFVNDAIKWGGSYKNNLDCAQNHPIASGAMLFVSKLFSQAEFYVENTSTGKIYKDHRLLDGLRNPNYYQTQSDFLEASLFMQIAHGKSIVWKRKVPGMTEPTLYILNPYKIEYPADFKTNLSVAKENNSIKKIKILYDRGGDNIKIPIEELMFFYDMPNGYNTDNMFVNASRLDGLKQTLINTRDSLKAKNVILKTNGKEILKTKKDGLQLSNGEKKEAEQLMQSKYGMGYGRSRALITKADVEWQSMHIPVRDLGLDESVKVDGNLIYTALHIPKDILSLEAKKTTYNNFKESMTSYIQNELQPTLDSFCEVLNKHHKDGNLVIKGTFENLPIMQFNRLEKFDSVKRQAEALKLLREAGVPDEVALEMLGMDPTMELGEMQQNTANEQSSEANAQGAEAKRNGFYKGETLQIN